MKNITWSLVATMILLASAINAEEAPAALTASCIACHGAKGISANDQWPNLAGQQEVYLINEMNAFRDGKRVDPLMSVNLRGFSDTQIEAVANYYSGLPAVQQETASVNEVGKNIRARCISCHGMTGNTVTSSWPNIAGQKNAYLRKQLMDFKTGARKGPVMEVIASELSDEEITDVAEYFSQI